MEKTYVLKDDREDMVMSDKIEVKVYYDMRHFPELDSKIKKAFKELGMRCWASGSDFKTRDIAFDWPITEDMLGK